jgi:SAM-dependent methyltransferase
MINNHWNNLHKKYSDKDWKNKPSLFAETVCEYLPSKGKILELGAGLGQDSLFFAMQGYGVTSTDLSIDYLKNISNTKNIEVSQVDLSNELPFKKESYDVVYAHLSLHYFDAQTTKRIFKDIYSVLKSNGVLAFFTNSIDDPEYGTGVLIEPDYFKTSGTQKKYFNVETATKFAHHFKPLLVDNNGETYKDRQKGVHNLIRFIGVKI